MQVNNNVCNSPNFGMFHRNSYECAKYLRSGFESVSETKQFKRAIKTLDKICDKHKNFDMKFNKDDNSIILYGTNVSANSLLKYEFGKSPYIVPQDVYRPNRLQGLEEGLKGILKGEEAPKDAMDRFYFKIFSSVTRFGAKVYLKFHPYEKLPANVREAVEMANRMEELYKGK